MSGGPKTLILCPVRRLNYDMQESTISYSEYVRRGYSPGTIVPIYMGASRGKWPAYAPGSDLPGALTHGRGHRA